MAWYDVVLGVATGGLYTAGKAIYQAGNAADDIGGAAEEAGLAIAVIGSTLQSLGEQLESTLQEAEELLTIKRLTPRSEADLWDEEKDRLKALRQEKKRLEDKLKDNGINGAGNFNFDFWDIISGLEDVIENFQLMARLAAVKKEIHDIYYQEPGVLTNTIYNAKETLERFNTIEQPMIEDILDSLDDNLDVSEEVLQEVKKLFVTKKKIPISIAELSPSIQDHINLIQNNKQYYAGLIERKDPITAQFADVIKTFPVNKFEISNGSVAMAGVNIKDLGLDLEAPEVGGVVRDDINDNVRDNIRDTIRDNRDDIRVRNPADVGRNINVGRNVVSPRTVNLADVRAETRRAELSSNIESTRTISAEGADARTVSSDNRIRSSATDASAIANMSKTKFAINNLSAFSMKSIQPHGAKVSASVSTKFDGYQRSFDLMNAQKVFYFRKGLKLERKYEKLANRWEETPGIIPKTLDEVHGVLKNVRTEEQPRIDLLLDNVNATLEEAKGTVEKANDTMDSVKNALSILDFDTKYLKIGGMVIGGLVVLNLFFGLLVLIRMTLGF